jgi:hypothetical protein
VRADRKEEGASILHYNPESSMKRRETMTDKALFAIGCFLLLASTAVAQDTLWTRTYGYLNWEQGWSGNQTSDGGYIIAGWTRSLGLGDDFYLVKTDASGNALWDRNYGGDYQDVAYSVQQTSDGGYIIVGYTESYGAGSEDYYIVKTNSIGDPLWTRAYGGSSYDYGHCVQQTSDGGYIIVGTAYSFGSFCDIWLLKTDSSGDTLWTRTYGGSNYDEGWYVQQTSDGGYIITGCTKSFGPGEYSVYLVKTNSSGDTLWTRVYGGTRADYGRCVQQTSDGGYIVAGYTWSFGAGWEDLYLLKTDSSGDTLWTRVYGGSDKDYGRSVNQTSDGGYIISGDTKSFGTGSNYDVYLLKTDSSGDTLWTRRYGGDWNEQGWSVQETSEGGYIIAGTTNSFGAGNYDVYLVRVAGEELPAVSIELVPDHSPVIVPRGGSFGFTGTVTNNTDVHQRVDIWLMAYVPGIGMYGPLRDYSNVPFNPHQSRSAHLNQNIPNIAPISDEYIYYGYVGDYPDIVIDSSYFPFEVTAKGFAKAGGSDWILTGSFLEGDEVNLPAEFALSGSYPNPFNAETVIEYQLPEASEVRLEVYNILGEKVATLVDSEQKAGYRSVVWDASNMSSGLYFYKLSAGDFTQTKRMMLVK